MSAPRVGPTTAITARNPVREPTRRRSGLPRTGSSPPSPRSASVASSARSRGSRTCCSTTSSRMAASRRRPPKATSSPRRSAGAPAAAAVEPPRQPARVSQRGLGSRPWRRVGAVGCARLRLRRPGRSALQSRRAVRRRRGRAARFSGSPALPGWCLAQLSCDLLLRRGARGTGPALRPALRPSRRANGTARRRLRQPRGAWVGRVGQTIGLDDRLINRLVQPFRRNA